MIPFTNTRLGGVILAVGLATAIPGASSAQRSSESAALGHRTWPRWESAPTPVPSGAPSQDASPSEGSGLFGLSVLGAAAGWGVGVLAGVAVCWEGCGDGEYEALVPVLLTGVVGGALGSTLLGCSAVHEPGCAPRVLPKAFLGTLAAVAGSVAIVSATDNALAGLVTFSAIQGLITARAIR